MGLLDEEGAHDMTAARILFYFITERGSLVPGMGEVRFPKLRNAAARTGSLAAQGGGEYSGDEYSP